MYVYLYKYLDWDLIPNPYTHVSLASHMLSLKPLTQALLLLTNHGDILAYPLNVNMWHHMMSIAFMCKITRMWQAHEFKMTIVIFILLFHLEKFMCELKKK